MPFSRQPHQSPLVFRPRKYSISPMGPWQRLPLSTNSFTTHGSSPEVQALFPPSNNSLISTSKFVDARYTIVYNNKEVNYYEKATTKIIVLEDAVLQGWQCPCNKLWHVPLVPNVWNLNTDTILLDHPLGHLSLHAMYEVDSHLPAYQCHLFTRIL
jgi:hypothetical protein